MADPYHTILIDTLSLVDDTGRPELLRLCESMGYWAPEVREYLFWHGHGGVMGYIDILNNFFRDNVRVRQLYNKFMSDIDEMHNTVEV